MEDRSSAMIKKPHRRTHLRQAQQSEMTALLPHWHFQKRRLKAVWEVNTVAQVTTTQETLLPRTSNLGRKAHRTTGQVMALTNRKYDHQ